MSNDATGSGRRAAAAAEYRPLRDLTPDEVDAHMFELYEEHAVRKEQRQRGEPVPDAGPVHLVARFIESEACKVLDANGYRPLRDLAGLSQEDVRLQWMNEVFQQGKAIGTDAIPYGTALCAAFEVMLYSSDLRTALEEGDAEGAALHMMGMINAALSAGFYAESRERAAAEAKAEKARREANEASTPTAAARALRKEAGSSKEEQRVREFAEPLLRDGLSASQVLTAIKNEMGPLQCKDGTVKGWITDLRKELDLPQPPPGRKKGSRNKKSQKI